MATGYISKMYDSVNPELIIVSLETRFSHTISLQSESLSEVMPFEVHFSQDTIQNFDFQNGFCMFNVKNALRSPSILH